MKTIAFVLLVLTVNAYGYDYGNQQQNSGYNSDSGYIGPTGTRYQYDMNDVGNRIRYKSDSGAQIRDKIYGNQAGPQIDRNLNQQGGGVRW